MTIICIDPKHHPAWAQLIAAHPNSSIFHTPAWLAALTGTYGFEFQAHVLLDDSNTPQAGIVYCEIDDVRGRRIVCIPFSDFCDPLVSTLEEWQALITPLINKNLPIIQRCVHNEILLHDPRFTLTNRAKWHGMDLGKPLDALWRDIHSSAQRAIRKAQRSGIVIRPAHKADLRDFFELHLKLRKHKYRMLAQPYAFFENIWQHLIDTQQGILLVACHQDKVIGGVMFLHWGQTFTYKFSVSNQDDLNYRPTDLLIWEGIRYAHERGYRQLDFGLSDWDQEGLIRYKRKFASEEKTISFMKFAPENASAGHPQIGDLLPRITKLFTADAVGDAITEDAGALLYRFFA